MSEHLVDLPFTTSYLAIFRIKHKLSLK